MNKSLKCFLKNLGSISAISLNSTKASSKTVSSSSYIALMGTLAINGSRLTNSRASLPSAICKKLEIA